MGIQYGTNSYYSLMNTHPAAISCSTNRKDMKFFKVKCNDIFSQVISLSIGMNAYVLCPSDCEYNSEDKIDLNGDLLFSENSSVCKALY